MKRKESLAAGIILVCSVVFRLLFISTRPIWYDEAFSLLLVEQPLPKFFRGLLGDVHPPGYYLSFWGWMRIFPKSILSARLFSVVFGLASVLVIYLVGTELFSKKVGYTAAGLMAVAPFHVHYSQEIRMYSMLGFFLLLATYSMLKAISKEKWFWWVSFALSSTLAQYTHNLAIIYLVLLALSPLFFRKKKFLIHTFVASLGSLLLYIPWLSHLLSQFSKITNINWTEKPTIARIFTTLLSYISHLPIKNTLLPAVLFGVLLVTILTLWQTIRLSLEKEQEAWPGFWLAALSFGPVFLLFGISLWRPVFIERAFLASGMMFLLWVSWVFWRTKLPQIMQALLALSVVGVMGSGLYQHYTYQGFPYGPYRKLSSYFSENLSTGERVVHSNKLTMLPTYYHDSSIPQVYVDDPEGSDTDTLSDESREALGVIEKPNIEAAASQVNTIYFVIFSREISEVKEQGLKTHPYLLWLEENFRQEDLDIWQDIRVYKFRER
ncbi:MAG: glycosyltransferase family 39 protein [Anaerolineales bacterium]|nr:glycosyltransferase family 39 protein [Anaerolineales bacterium]